jgi:flagellar biosynthesis protein FlhF
MRVFSKILGVPFHIVSSISDLDQIVKESQNSLILVDTPGFGSKEKDLPVVLSQIFSKKFDVEYHLCLASTEKESYLEKVIQHALNLGISGISFTKLDQSLTYGELFNLSKRWSIPLAYFSYGTNIPDDLERATKERVIERIFGS